MGRYYTGDIEGKFWFAVQSSDDAGFFGGQTSEPQEIEYHFEKDDEKSIDEGIERCIDELGENKEKLDEFFNDCDFYNDEGIAKHLGVTVGNVKEVMTWYARLGLGLKIQKCVKDKGECNFTADAS